MDSILELDDGLSIWKGHGLSLLLRDMVRGKVFEIEMDGASRPAKARIVYPAQADSAQSAEGRDLPNESHCAWCENYGLPVVKIRPSARKVTV